MHFLRPHSLDCTTIASISTCLTPSDAPRLGEKSLNMQELIIVIVPGAGMLAARRRASPSLNAGDEAHNGHSIVKNMAAVECVWLLIESQLFASLSFSLSSCALILQTQSGCNHSTFSATIRHYMDCGKIYRINAGIHKHTPTAFITRTKAQYFKCAPHSKRKRVVSSIK